MARKKKRACKKNAKEKPAVVNDNEEAFLNFVDQNARKGFAFNEVVDQITRQNSGIDGFSDVKLGEISSGSESGSSSSSSRGGGPFHVDSGFDESPIPKGVQKQVKKRGRPPKKGKVANKATNVLNKSLKGLVSTSGKGKQPGTLNQDPRYNKEELKASFAVIKKIMEMDEAKSFSSPVDPVSMGILDYFDVVDTPMDFGTICTNLRNGVKYLNADDVYKDVQYIWQNCLKYNKKGDYIVYLMKRVKKKFMKYWTAAGLNSEILTKTSGHSDLAPSNDHATRHSQHDAISLVNHMVGNLNQMPQNNFGVIHPQSQVPLPSCSQPYQLHQPQSQVPLPDYSQPYQLHQPQSQVPLPGYSQPYQSHQPQSQVPLPNYNQPYQSHQPQSQMPLPSYSQPYQSHQPQSQMPLPSYSQPYQSHQPQQSTIQPPQFSRPEVAPDSYYSGNSHLVPSNDLTKRSGKVDTVSMVSHRVGSQIKPDNFGTIQPQSQVPIYQQPHQLRQPQTSTTQPQLLQSQAGTGSNYEGKHSGGSHMQQEDFGNTQSQAQVPFSGYRQPSQSHQSQPITNELPQLSQLQAGSDTNHAGHSDLAALMGRSLKRKKYATRGSMASMMSSQNNSKQQPPQSSSCHLEHSQQSPCQPQPQPSQSHFIADIDDSGHPLLPSVDYMMEQNGVPRFQEDPSVVDHSELQVQQSPLNRSPLNESHQPQSSMEQPQPSQPLASVDISSSVVLGVTRAAATINKTKRLSRGRRHARPQRSSEDHLCTEMPLVSVHHLSQQPLEHGNLPDESEQPKQKTKKRTRVRGPTLCREMWDMRDGERIAVPFNTLGQPVGPEASKLSTFLGTVARNGEMAPLTFVDWFAMPDDKKENMWQFVQTKFDIQPMFRTWVMRSLASKWRNWKAKLKSDHYYPHKTDEERLKDRDQRVLPDQWAILISYWNSEEAQLRSAKNKANRANQKSTHTSGSKSFARIREEEKAKQPDGKEPTRAELYIRTRTRKDGQPVNNVAAELIAKLHERKTENDRTSNDSNDLDDAFFKVMGEEKNGHVRMYGLGPTPSDFGGQKLGRMELVRMASEAKKSANEEVSKMLSKMEAMEEKYASMEAQVARMTSSMQNFFDRMGVSEPSKVTASNQVPGNLNAPEDSMQSQEHSSSSSHEVPSNEVD